MAKQSLFGSGKNAVQQTGHIRSSSNYNGGQATKTHVGTSGNPYNEFVRDDKGVLGPNVVAQNAGRSPDNPVPDNAQLPNLAIRSKASEASSLASEAQFPADGVMHR